MQRALIAFTTLFLAACSVNTTTPPAASPGVAVPQAECNPGHALVNATLWVQTAAEFRASAIQTYTNARRALDEALADPTWTGATEETSNDPAQPPAVILDVDETVLDNSSFEVRTLRTGKTYDEAIWQQFTAEAASLAVPGAAEFLAYAKSRGVTPFYITNRDLDEDAGTRANLIKLGYPIGTDPDTLLLRGEKAEWISDKSSRRAWVAASYRVLLVIGDDLNDFASARDKSIAERHAIIDRTAALWGRKWFMVSNPMYGSWERAVTGGSGAPCEQLQKKIDAMRP